MNDGVSNETMLDELLELHADRLQPETLSEDYRGKVEDLYRKSREEVLRRMQDGQSS